MAFRITSVLVLILSLLLSGCDTVGSINNESARLRQEINNTKQELQTIKDQLTAAQTELEDAKKQLTEANGQFEAVTKDLETCSNSLEETKQQLATEKANNETRNQLDLMLYQVVDSLVIGDIRTAKKSFVKEAQLTKDIVTTFPTKKGVKFEIPDEKMNLRQRSTVFSGETFTSIYEIYNAGYTKEPKYNERLYTLNVNYVKENGKWKIKSIFIDE